METVLRIAAQPNTRLENMWSGEGHWALLVELALKSYICLNVFYATPETHIRTQNTASHGQSLEVEKHM
jgi:hypothetical protein